MDENKFLPDGFEKMNDDTINIINTYNPAGRQVIAAMLLDSVAADTGVSIDDLCAEIARMSHAVTDLLAEDGDPS